MTSDMTRTAAAIRAFWLDEVGPKGWYVADDGIDEAIRARFRDAWEAARHGPADAWLALPESALAHLILLDQFPRNMFRGTAMAYATDERARARAKLAIETGFDLKTAEPARQFFYLPLMHSECLADQERCVALVRLRLPETGGDNLEHAVKHREVIRRFGRFPSRNAALGRADRAAERAYREAGGYMG